MRETDYHVDMLDMIKLLLNGEMSYDEFADRYWDYYLRKVPQGILSEREEAFFGAVQERIDHTDENPDDEDRCEMGWMDPEEFIEWLGERLEEFESGAEMDLDWF